MPRPTLPPAVDPKWYKERYGDLAHMSDDQAAEHFAQWGQREGRGPSRACWRNSFVNDFVKREVGTILEIGPFANPSLVGDNIRYLDVLDEVALRARATKIGMDASSCPDRIHYVGDLDTIEDQFAAVFSSHSIEHQPDLIYHLAQVERVLEPGGRYYILCPDKRFCFDALQAETTIAGVLQAHRERRQRHLLQSVIEHRALTVHNDPQRHWNADHGTVTLEHIQQQTMAAIAEYDGTDAYIDVHAWYFTPRNFASICETLFQLGMVGLKPVAVYSTPRDSIEFCAVLERT